MNLRVLTLSLLSSFTVGLITPSISAQTFEDQGPALILENYSSAINLLSDLEDFSRLFVSKSQNSNELFDLVRQFNADSFESASAGIFLSGLPIDKVHGRKETFMKLINLVIARNDTRVEFLRTHLAELTQPAGIDAVQSIIRQLSQERSILIDGELYAVAMSAQGYTLEDIESSARTYYVARTFINVGLLPSAEISNFKQPGPATQGKEILIDCNDSWYISWPWWKDNHDDKYHEKHRRNYTCRARQSIDWIVTCVEAGCLQCGSQQQCVTCCNTFRRSANPGNGQNGNGCRDWCRDNWGQR